MNRRTQAQIEKDYKTIKKVAANAKTFKEIETLTGLSYAEIMVSLNKHPRVCAKIKHQMESARCNPVNSEVEGSKEQYIVIDASITSIPNIENVLRTEKMRIIITSVAVKELSQMQHFEDADAMRARHLLLMAAEEEDRFVHKLIDESLATADDCILDFCVKNKENVTLYTADKEMYNLAKIYSVPARFFKAQENEKKRKGLLTFRGITSIGNDLVIDLDRNNTAYKMVRVISNDKEFDEGIVRLKLGDEIMLASQKEGYVAFAHYKVTSLWAKDNCALLFSRRVHDFKNLKFNYRYKSFLRDFKRKVS